MKCDKCGFIPNPGDQVCINCGAKLSSDNATILGVDVFYQKELKKKRNNFLIIVFTSLGIILVMVVIFLFIKYVIL